MSLLEKTAVELLEEMESGSLRSRDVVEAFCDQIEATDGAVEAFLHFDREKALSDADRIDRKRAANEPVGKLAGLPVAIKDVLCEKGVPTTCASRILEGFRPPYDAHVVSRLREEDAVAIGRVNLDEFAMGSSTENSGYRKTRNPWDLRRTPGGSSGGSAACVAARQTPLSLGTDTGGSVRQPASFCGVVGLKPTYGRVSRYGLVAFASSLDQIGPVARTVEDAALLLEVIAGHDSRDSTSVVADVPKYRQALSQPLEGLRVGICPEHFAKGVADEVEKAVREAIAVLEKLGLRPVEVSLPHAKYAIATYYLVATAEASSNLARYDGVHYGKRAEDFDGLVDMYCATRGEFFGDEVKRRIMLGTFALSAGYRDAYYVKALRVRRLIANDYHSAFESCDVLAGPVAPTPAFLLGEKIDDPLAMYLNDLYTVSANLAGIPAVSVPCGFTTSGLPIGLQLHAGPFREELLLRVGHGYQKETDWASKAPTMSAEA